MAFITWPSSHGRHRMASLCSAGPGCAAPAPTPGAHFIAFMAFITWHSSHGRHRMASLCLAGRGCSAWQGEGAWLTSQKAAAPYPCRKLITSSPSCSSSALIAWLHRAWKGEGARMTSQKAAAPPTPRILVQTAHFIAFMVFIALVALIAWPSSHGFIVLGRARVLG